MLFPRRRKTSVPSNLLTGTKCRLMCSIPIFLMTPRFLEHTLNAYRALEELCLRIALYDCETTIYPHVEGLPALLEATTKLKRLKLRFSEDWDYEHERRIVYSYEQVFPPHKEWIELEYFGIEGIPSRRGICSFYCQLECPTCIVSRFRLLTYLTGLGKA